MRLLRLGFLPLWTPSLLPNQNPKSNKIERSSDRKILRSEYAVLERYEDLDEIVRTISWDNLKSMVFFVTFDSRSVLDTWKQKWHVSF